MQYKTLADLLAVKLNMTRDEVDALCDSLGEIIGKYGCDMDTVSIPGFGSFEPRKREERESVNPATGVRMLLPPKMVLGFRPSGVLKRKVRELDPLMSSDSDGVFMTRGSDVGNSAAKGSDVDELYESVLDDSDEDNTIDFIEEEEV